MDERQTTETIGHLTGVITALEMQVQALLIAAAKAGTDPKDVRQAVEILPVPVVPNLGKDAYQEAMAGFMQRLEQVEAQLENDVPESRPGWLERLLEVVRRR